MSLKFVIAAALLGVATYMTAQATRESELVPTGKGYGVAADHANGNNGNAKPTGQSRSSCTNGICYHGGPLMTGTPTIYYIWYGNWGGTGSNSTTTISILDSFINNLGGSSYENINTTYSISGSTISGALAHSNSSDVFDNYSQGTSFGDAGVQAIVAAKINSGALPKSSNALYFVLTSSDVNETSGFCTQYCGWHTH